MGGRRVFLFLRAIFTSRVFSRNRRPKSHYKKNHRRNSSAAAFGGNGGYKNRVCSKKKDLTKGGKQKKKTGGGFKGGSRGAADIHRSKRVTSQKKGPAYTNRGRAAKGQRSVLPKN